MDTDTKDLDHGLYRISTGSKNGGFYGKTPFEISLP